MRFPLFLAALSLAIGPAWWAAGWREDGAIRIRALPLSAAATGGPLQPVGAWLLSSRDRRFGGFSAMVVEDRALVLLSDSGWALRLGSGRAEWQDVGTAGAKAARDSESLAHDPATGRWWIGFEGRNMIARRDGLERAAGTVRPKAMRRWPSNGGPESLVRLPDGRFVVLAEKAVRPDGARQALLFGGDPVAGARVVPFGYRPPTGMDPSDTAALPDGRLVVLNRTLGVRGFAATLTLVDLSRLRAGATVTGRPLARIAPPIDNMEGVAVVQDATGTTLWLVSDDNHLPVERTLLLKFRLKAPER